MPAPLTLRERNKAATRQLLADVAAQLFTDEGYDEVSLDRIVAESGVSSSTLLRYFETKEHLALARHFEALDRFRLGLRQRSSEVGALEYWRQHVASYAQVIEEDPARWQRHFELVETVPLLTARFLGVQRGYEDLLAAEFAGERGQAAPAMNDRLLAATVVHGHLAVLRHWLHHMPATNVAQLCLSAIDFISSNLGSFASPTSPTN